MCKVLSAKYYQENKNYKKKKLTKGIKTFLTKIKNRGNNVVNVTKISETMKNKSLLSIEKIL